ncbi:MAG: 50S ribosomal protein L3 [Candidatus Bathyarchaeota archaeon]|nr:50S ribosomal protein L3 [Candidatus Bathyarchaeota archaeon]
MPRVRSPKRGSRSYSPRKRARSANGRVSYWPTLDTEPALVGFAGYKAGMTHLFYIEDSDRVPQYGQEVKAPATVIDTPPMLVIAVRAYKKTYDGLEAMTEAWMANQPKDLYRRITFTTDPKPNEKLAEIEKNLDKVAELRVIAATQPKETSVSKKVPDIMEIPVSGGSMEAQFNYAKGLLGQTVTINDVFSLGEGIDVVGVSKGKGFQGPVKRWGIRILSRKSRKSRRAVASIGPWVPRRVMPQVPRAGQMGFHNRTEYNKRIMLMNEDTDRINPKAGFKNYGFVNGDYLLLKGSVMGAAKRLIKLRKAVRKPKYPDEAPQITYLHSEWKKRSGEQ